MKRVLRIITSLIPITALVLTVSQVVVSNELGSLGKRLGELEQDIMFERDTQASLETQIASESALLAVRERAISLGFSEPTGKQIVNVSPEVPVAFEVGGSVARLPIE